MGPHVPQLRTAPQRLDYEAGKIAAPHPFVISSRSAIIGAMKSNLPTLTLALLTTAVTCASFLPAPASAAPESVDAGFAELKAQVETIRKDLDSTKTEVASLKEKLHELTAEPPAFTPVSVTLDSSSADDFVLGDPNAPVTIMEFFDYLCGYCEMFHDQIFPDIKKSLIDTGKVRFIFRDFPISGEQASVRAAAFADCAGKQGRYLEAHDALFQSYEAVAAGKIEEVAKEIGGLTVAKLTQCMESPEYKSPLTAEELTPSKELAADIEEGNRLGIDGTPAFLVFRTAPAGSEIQGQLIGGAQPVQIFEQVVALVQEQK